MRFSCFVLACLIFFLPRESGASAPQPPAQARDAVLAGGSPPLTRQMVSTVVDFFEWSLSVRLSAEQRAQVQQSIVDSWKKNDRDEIGATLQLLGLHAELSKLSDEDLGKAREVVRAEVVKGLRQQPDDETARMLLSLHEASGRAVAPRAPAGAPRAGPANAPRAPRKVGPGDLYGIYIATTKQLIAPGPGSPVQYGITWLPGRDWITFLPGGRFFARLPEEGLTFDYEAAARKWPEAVGTYQVSGNLVRVKWAQPGFPDRVFRLDPSGELWEERTNWTPLPKGDGLRLDGRYAIVGNEYARAYIRFSPDGRFAEEGLLQHIGWKSLGTREERAVAEVPRGSGTYNFGDSTLELRYDDGRVARINFYTFSEQLKEPRPKVIYINSFDFQLVP
jgi:hypothetical protein